MLGVEGKPQGSKHQFEAPPRLSHIAQLSQGEAKKGGDASRLVGVHVNQFVYWRPRPLAVGFG